ncbi:T9SS type A sorting domain-containing protein [bacterium]
MTMRFLRLFLCALFVVTLLKAQYPVKIGQSIRQDATAFNNARRIVRTSDDKRIVVYQDSLDGMPVVMWTTSSNGLDWREPQMLEYGAYPAIAVSEDDWVYVVWETVSLSQSNGAFLRNNQTEWHKSGVVVTRFPCVDVLDREVYIVSEWNNDIYFSQVDSILNDYLVFSENVSQSETASSMPIVVTDLEYYGNHVNLIWSEMDDAGLYQIQNFQFLTPSEYSTREGFYEWFDNCSPVTLPELSGIRYPSASQRGYSVYFAGGTFNQEMATATFFRWNDNDCGEPSVSVQTYDYEESFPSIDDIGPKGTKCAVVWQHDDEIMSGILYTSTLLDLSVQQISTENGVPKYFPNICYKTFRIDSFDVVWTEGLEGSYDIMYGRYEKWPGKFAMFPLREETMFYKKSDSNYFAVLGDYYPYLVQIENLPSGLTMMNIGNNLWFSGRPEESGTFELCLIFSSHSNPTWIDTTYYTLVVHNTAPQLTSSDVIHATPGEEFKYRAQAVDDEGNDITFIFDEYPDYLKIYIAELYGIIPGNAQDTSFVVIATDGEKSDTLYVMLDIEPASSIDDETEHPSEFALKSNYPNPFNSRTIIRYQLPVKSSVKIIVLNINGELIDTVIDDDQTAGNFEIQWDASEVPSGLYFIQMQTDNFTMRKKCLLVK